MKLILTHIQSQDAINSIYRDDYGDYLYYNYEYEEDVNDESINDIEVG